MPGENTNIEKSVPLHNMTPQGHTEAAKNQCQALCQFYLRLDGVRNGYILFSQ